MSPDFWLAIAQHPRSAGLQAIARGQNVIDLIADMVNAAGGIALKEGGDGRRLAERVEQLDLRIRKCDENRGDAVLRHLHGVGDFGAKCLAIQARRRRKVRHRNRHMVQPSNHALT